MLVDTHCHIHLPTYGVDPDVAIANAQADGVSRLIAVGCTLDDSKQAIQFASNRENVWASIGLHPHEASVYAGDAEKLQEFADLAHEQKVIAVGECGLDYYYNHSPKEAQIELLKFQIEVALAASLPMIFHVREAFDDFWPIFDSYEGIRGVIHSFSASKADLEQILARGLYVGLNGIMTFTNDAAQLDAAKAVPLEKMVLETDAPYLTPKPFRGKICEPKHVRVTAEFLAGLRKEDFEVISSQTTQNVLNLFGI